MEEGEGEREERASIWAELQGQITIQDDSDGEAGGGGEEEEEEEEAPKQSKLTKAQRIERWARERPGAASSLVWDQGAALESTRRSECRTLPCVQPALIAATCKKPR